jgi:hypothetical protein
MQNHTAPIPSDGLQERLAADRQGIALRGLRDHLAGKRAHLRRLLDDGAAPEEFSLYENLMEAVDAAEKAALAFWEKHNKD